MKKSAVFLLLISLFIFPKLGFTQQGFTQKDREMLIELKATLTTFMHQTDKRFEEMREDMNKRFEQIDKRFEELREDMNKRFEQIDKRFEQVNAQINQLYTFLWILTGIFTTLTLGVIGFAYWDRRTIIAEAKRQTLETLERETKPEKLLKLLNVLRTLAKEDKRLAEVLKTYGLL